jgi:Fur family ferric uptake transcriptional regulator
MRSESYRTKQREAIRSYIVSLEGSDVTAAQIVEHFKKADVAIGRTTVYRFLDRMVERGELRRYTIDGKVGSFYQLVDGGDNCHVHFHLKCEDCGSLEHLDCDELEEIQLHVFKEHAFQVNALKTVFYGKCSTCGEKA